jgi:hypothetical protein
MTRRTSALALLALSALAGTALAQGPAIRLNELFLNPPGADDGQEFVEIKAAPNTALTGLWLVIIEGDASVDSTQAGIVDQAINLGAFSTGSNGLLLIRDTAAVLTPAPDAGTSVVTFNFTPDLENGTNTFLLVRNWTGTVGGTDIDAGDDGTVDLTPLPWTEVLDAIGIKESLDTGGIERTYAASFGGTDVQQDAFFTPDAMVRAANGEAYIMDVLGAAPGPYTFDPAEFLPAAVLPTLPETAKVLTPGRENLPGVVVNPCPNLSNVAGPNQTTTPDDALTADDIIVFLGWYFGNDARADVAGANQTTTPDTQFTADDIIVFLGRYFAGC